MNYQETKKHILKKTYILQLNKKLGQETPLLRYKEVGVEVNKYLLPQVLPFGCPITNIYKQLPMQTIIMCVCRSMQGVVNKID